MDYIADNPLFIVVPHSYVCDYVWTFEICEKIYVN
jgi:hypothetical protein